MRHVLRGRASGQLTAAVIRIRAVRRVKADAKTLMLEYITLSRRLHRETGNSLNACAPKNADSDICGSACSQADVYSY